MGAKDTLRRGCLFTSAKEKDLRAPYEVAHEAAEE
jgi:hypothetical protein